MGDFKLIVPRGIRYISEWKDYSLENFQFQHILNKKIPGCGYTEYCIVNNLPIVLCSPRKILLENKAMQHPGEVFYFNNQLEIELDTGKEIGKNPGKAVSLSLDEEAIQKMDDTEKNTILQTLFAALKEYLRKCYTTRIPPKILVTYDSFHYVKQLLGELGILHDFYVVIDEFQSAMIDSRFKASTELEFISQIQGLSRVCLVSATPILDKYLKMIDEFKNLPYYELDWGKEDPLRVMKPDLKVRAIRSINSISKEIIDSYKSGNFETAYFQSSPDEAPRIVESREAVIYVNSVNNIISIIKTCELEASECNILCARTIENETKIRRALGKTFKVGTVPLRGEPHKMFTFCTRTVYLGADFYSTNARTFIFSNANIDSLSVDISIDLPQILGRQRLSENPWKNRAELYYKILEKGRVLTEKDFNRRLGEKMKETKDLLNSYKDTRDTAKGAVTKNLRKLAKAFNYKDNYVSVNTLPTGELVPVLNNLVLVSEIRAFDIQQIDYKDRFSVFSSLSLSFKSDTPGKVDEFVKEFNEAVGFYKKMKLLCESGLDKNEILVALEQVPMLYRNYYLSVGPDRCKALSYDSTKIKRYLDDINLGSDRVKIELGKRLVVGEKYTRTFIKDLLKDVYSEIGLNRSPKASDLDEFFYTRECKMYNSETGKRDHGFEILEER